MQRGGCDGGSRYIALILHHRPVDRLQIAEK